MSDQQIPHPEPHIDAEPTLSDLLFGLWRQRTIIFATMAVAGLIALSAAGLMVALKPPVTSHQLRFQLQFSGAQNNQYPSGAIFRANDIVSPSVVRPLYDSLGIAELDIPYDEFKNTLTVVERSDASDQIRLEYEARLSNSRLTQSERQAIEEEYQAALAATRNGEFMLRILDPGNRIPEATAANVLNGILLAWAEEAQRVHGAWTYDVAVPGQNLIDETAMADEDYLVVTDMLRMALQRVDSAAKQLSEIPGANLVRLPGENSLSLVEVRARIEDAVRFKIEPLYARIYSQGAYRDRELATVYLNHRLFRLGLQTDTLKAKGQAISQALDQLGQRPGDGARSSGSGGNLGAAAIIPQFSEGFFDKLMEIGVQSADVDFRRQLAEEAIALQHETADLEEERRLYESLLNLMEDEGHDLLNIDPELQSKALKDLDERFAEVLATTRNLINNVQALHLEISTKHLQPHRIFAITAPLEQRQQSTLSMRGLVAIIAVCLLLGGMLALLLAWLRHITAGRRAAQAAQS